MKKGWKITVIIGFILLIGGGVSYAMGFNKDYFDYLDRKKYTEEYTSPIDGDESLVLYKAQNGHFSMKLPKHFFILEETHGIGSDTHEKFRAVYHDPEYKDSDKGVVKRIKVIYNFLPEEEVNVAAQLAIENYAFENQYKKEESEDRVVYTGESHTIAGSERLDPKEHGTNTFFAFISGKEKKHSIEINYYLTCFEDDREKCKFNEEKERKIFSQLIESIRFVRM